MLTEQLKYKNKNEWDSVEEYINFLQAYKGYEFSVPYIKGKRVIEIGCGTGYGTNLLLKYAKSILGLDISREAIDYCNKTWKGVNFKKISGEWIDKGLMLKERYDCAVSFHIIEHIEPQKVRKFLFNIKNVLNKKGILLISTPNKKYRLWPFMKPWNKFHLKEYNFIEFNKVLKSVFKNVEINGLYFLSKEAKEIDLRRINITKRGQLCSVPVIGLFYRIYTKLNRELFIDKKIKKLEMNNFVDRFSSKDLVIREIVNKEEINNCVHFIAICK